MTDSAGGSWFKAGESGIDNHTGINISCWICESAVGGPTDLTVTFSNDSQQLACLLLEFANLPSRLKVQSLGQRTFGSDIPHLSTSAPVSAGDIAFAFRTSIYVLPQGPGSPGWKQIMSDTTGANALMMLTTSAGRLTASWSGRWCKVRSTSCCWRSLRVATLLRRSEGIPRSDVPIRHLDTVEDGNSEVPAFQCRRIFTDIRPSSLTLPMQMCS